MLARRLTLAVVLCASLATPVFADTTLYRKPPPAIETALQAPPNPIVATGPRRGVLAIETPLRYPPVADLARPMLRLAGLRIDPATNGIHHARAMTSVAIEHVADGRVVRVPLPAGAHVTGFEFSPDETRFALTNATAAGTELWLGTTADGHAAPVAKLAVNDVFPGAFVWTPDAAHVVVRVVDRTGPAPGLGVAGGRRCKRRAARPVRSSPTRICLPTRTTNRCSSITARRASRSSMRAPPR